MMAVEVADVGREPIRDRFAQVAGEIAAAAWVVALIGSLPMALRMGPFLDIGVPRAWLALAALCTPLSIASLLVVRVASLGFRAAVPDLSRRTTLLAALGLWVTLASVVLGLFAALLSSGTHHRGLGATTFAIVGLGVAAGCAVVAVRLASSLSAVFSRPWVSWTLLGGSALVPTAWLYLSLRQTADASHPALLAVADACVFLALAVLTSRFRLPSRSQRFAVPAAVVLTVATIAAGVPSVSNVARSSEEARDNAVLLAPILDRISAPDAKIRPRRRAAVTPPASAAVPAAAPVMPTASASASAPATLPSPRVEKPDIVLVTLDSVRADHLSAYGYKRRTSPNLELLAARGALFERAYAAGPETRTALAPVLTGRWLEQCPRDDRSWPTLLRANETIAERLRAQGYATGAVSSFQWLAEERGAAQGFELFDESPFKKAHPEKGVTGASAIAQAIDAYGKLIDKDRPVFLWVHLFDAHQKYVEHDEFAFGKSPVDRYDGEIAYVDQELGRLIQRVSSGPRGSKTVWIVHGSHGDAFGEHGFTGHPAKVYEEVIRVPLLVALPWGKPARVTEPAVSVMDVVPTVLALAGGRGELPGISLVGLAQGESAASVRRTGVLVSYAGIAKSAPVRAWIEGNLKLVVHGRGDAEVVKLFDLGADPTEQTDVSSDRKVDAERLRTAMDAFVRANVSEVPLAPAQEP